jgi:aminopeptidase-like protein
MACEHFFPIRPSVVNNGLWDLSALNRTFLALNEKKKKVGSPWTRWMIPLGWLPDRWGQK